MMKARLQTWKGGGGGARLCVRACVRVCVRACVRVCGVCV